MALYDYRQSVLSLTGGGGRQLLFPSNDRRVSIIASSIGAGIYQLCDRDGAGLAGVWLRTTSLVGLVMTFHDFGPLIQGQVWAEALSGGTPMVIATEVLWLPDCDIPGQ